ncbi:MAG: Hsp20/alpha crystallin family protein [Bacillota bacterium]
MTTLSAYWNPRRNLNLFDEMEKFFDEAAAHPSTQRTLTPAWETSETESHFLLSLDLPGVAKEDIKIDFDKNTLTIAGERKRVGTFKRSFTLPNTVESEKIEARYENGVLEIILPKLQTMQPRRIEVQSTKSEPTEAQ